MILKQIKVLRITLIWLIKKQIYILWKTILNQNMSICIQSLFYIERLTIIISLKFVVDESQNQEVLLGQPHQNFIVCLTY